MTHVKDTHPELVEQFPMLLNVRDHTPENEAEFRKQFEEHCRVFKSPNPYVYSKKGDSNGTVQES